MSTNNEIFNTMTLNENVTKNNFTVVLPPDTEQGTQNERVSTFVNQPTLAEVNNNILLAIHNLESNRSTNKILSEIEQAFFTALETKTGWGKNDVKNLYRDVTLSVLKSYI